MKILFFIENLRSGGKERRLLELIIFLKANTNYELSLVLMDEWVDYPYIDELDINFIILKRGKFKKDPLIFKKFYNVVKNINPDIIHTWGPTVTFYAIPTKFLLKKVLLANIISNAKKSFSELSFQSFIYNVGFFFSDRILSNSMAGLKAYNLDTNSRSHLIYNGIRLSRFENVKYLNLRRELNIPLDAIIILMVASTAKNKDYDLFIDVAKTYNHSSQSLYFVSVGQGPDINRLKDRLYNENISNVFFLGKRTDVESLISESDICVLFTNNDLHGEGISNSIMEYLALGKPVISTDLVGGTGEIINDRINGFLVKPSVEEICKIIDEILNNPELLEVLNERGKNTILERFSIEIMGEKFISLYNSFV